MDTELSNPANDPAPVLASVEDDAVKCPQCGAMVAADAAFCPDCKWPMTPLSFSDRATAAAAYLPIVPSIVILLLPAFRSNRFVRFNAWQSIALWVVFLVLSSAILFLSNVAAAMIFLIVGILAALAMLFLWIVLSLKAWQGQRFELPLFGLLAARLA